jgi:hypothetical protein
VTTPTYGPVTARLVEYGIARLREEHQGQIVEPLAFLLMKWFQNHPSVSLERNLRSQLAVHWQFPRGDAYEQLVVLYLLRALRYSVPLSKIFKCDSSPSWADENIHNVDLPQNPGLGVMHYAEDIEDVLEWIENVNPAWPAVLVSTTQFSLDVLVRTSNGLLMGQFKSYMKGNKETLGTTMLSQALTSLNRNHWFKQSVCSLFYPLFC